MFDYRLSLAAGTDIPIPECQLAIHQPRISEIAWIGETAFLNGIQLLCLNKSMYIEDEAMMNQVTNFEIFMTMINEKTLVDKKEDVISVFQFLIPGAQIFFTPRTMVINKDGTNFNIDEGNFEILQEVLRQMFCLDKTDQNTFNPANAKAKAIADKLMRGRKRVAAQQEHNSSSMFGQYTSILAIGLHMGLKECMELTIYQLYDLVERFMLYINWDLDVRARIAGAKPDKPVDNWMKSIH